MTAQVYVATHLLGGLGNQLFQYAAGRALAGRLGASLVLDAAAFRTGYCQRPFELDRYPIEATVAWRGFRKGPRRGRFSSPTARVRLSVPCASSDPWLAEWVVAA